MPFWPVSMVPSERTIASKALACRLAAASRTIFSNTTVQQASEATTRRIITPFTIGSA